jgi:DNA-binding winged helix-turn-helix (wHTH) protein
VQHSDRTLQQELELPPSTGAKHAVLTVLQGEAIGRAIPVTEIRTIIGRGKTALVCISDPRASREHCEVLRIWDGGDSRYVLRDLSSTNGSFVNGIRALPELPLHDGDRIKVGKHLFRFSLLDDLELEAARHAIDQSADEKRSEYLLRFTPFYLPWGVDLLYRDDDVVPLEPQAVRVLRYLVEHSDRVIPKDELLEAVWPDVFTGDGVLKKAISLIRQALCDDAKESRFIQTYHRRGYRFIAHVERDASRRS